jgi:hypothetical protein
VNDPVPALAKPKRIARECVKFRHRILARATMLGKRD